MQHRQSSYGCLFKHSSKIIFHPRTSNFSGNDSVVFSDTFIYICLLRVFAFNNTKLFDFCITLFYNYPNCPGVYNTYKKSDPGWRQIGQGNFILHFWSPALPESQASCFLPLPLQLSLQPVRTSLMLLPSSELSPYMYYHDPLIREFPF